MVSKLLLATAEVITEAVQDDPDRNMVNLLLECFDEIQDGLGLHKAPEQYGAFPTDAYSHTPGFAGVQQPGMTGQVKEDVITRFCELGVKVSEGQIIFAPAILRREEFISEPANWSYWGSATEQCESLQSGSLAFTVCAVPVIYRLAQEYAIEVFDNDGGREIISGNQLGQARSLSLFQRDRRIQKIVVQIPRDVLR